jgi:Ca2+-binding EF-hand superfamily protein
MARLMGMLCMALAVGMLLSSAGAQEQKKGTFDIDAIFKKLDTNNDGKLSKDEFLKLADLFKDKGKAREKLTKAFEKFDTEKMGLTKVQFRKYVESVKKKDDTP